VQFEKVIPCNSSRRIKFVRPAYTDEIMSGLIIKSKKKMKSQKKVLFGHFFVDFCLIICYNTPMFACPLGASRQT